jgi:hypothetical protein
MATFTEDLKVGTSAPAGWGKRTVADHGGKQYKMMKPQNLSAPQGDASDGVRSSATSIVEMSGGSGFHSRIFSIPSVMMFTALTMHLRSWLIATTQIE